MTRTDGSGASLRADSPLVDSLRPSPNFGDRAGPPPDAVVLHYTGMATAQAALDRLADAQAQVSAHYVVMEDGCIVQMVAEDKRAWHAGRSFWRGETDFNSRSIGIEIVNPGHEGGLPPYPARQIRAVCALLEDILRRRGISPARVLAHSDIAPDRKEDPGERFPWRDLADQGLCLAARAAPIRGQPFTPGPAESLSVQRRLAAIGYAAPESGTWDEQTRLALAAFQRRHRPRRVDGLLDRSTLTTLARVEAALSALK
ncbi:MAG: N-acetylmuramoyl-L-alanine amidase [Rhizobiales bacterium]|nr:N-acetylmuramoyl-L-alanine amidase [Hyphomicrobiales bacterium]